MATGNVGKWLITSQGSAFTEADLQAIEKQGYMIVSISAHNHSETHIAYARYRGGRIQGNNGH
jgi:hypothetical protein